MKNCFVFAYHNVGIIGIKLLLKQKIKIVSVITHKDSNKENIWFNSVSKFCFKHKIKYYYFEDLGFKKIIRKIKKENPDFLFSFYFRNIFPSSLLNIPRLGSINLHGSFLPKYRGAAPINWQIINGEKNGGVTLHYMSEKIDKGKIIAQKKFYISKKDNPKSLFKKVEKKSQILLKKTLPKIINETNSSFKQNEKDATYFRKRKPKDGKISWDLPVLKIHNLIRGVTKPYPGAFTYFNKSKVHIWKSSIESLNSRNFSSDIGSFYKAKKYIKVRTKNGTLVIRKFNIEKNKNTMKLDVLDLNHGKFK